MLHLLQLPPGQRAKRLQILCLRPFHHVLGQLRRRSLLVPPDRLQIIAYKLLVEAANAIWFVLQIFIVMLTFGFVGNAIQNELAWMESSFVDSLLGGVVSLARGIGLACVCIMTVAVFYPGSETLPNAYLPRYLDGVTAVIAELTTNGLHSKIVLGLTPTEPNGRDGENPSS